MIETGDVREALLPPRRHLLDYITINPLSEACLGMDLLAFDTGWAAAAWTANLTTYVPLLLAQPMLVDRVYWVNGGTVGGSTDVGIYDEAGTTLLVHGLATNSGTSARQVVDVTDFTLPADQFLWMAISSDSGTQTYLRANPVVQILEAIGVKQHASDYSSGLPASATFNDPTVGILPMFGFSGRVV